MIAYCGLICEECDIYIATITENKDMKAEVAKKISSEDYPIGSHEINCYGCSKRSLEIFKFCSECEIRECGISKNIDNCGECFDYPCKRLLKPFEMEPKNKERLDAINKVWREK